MLKQPILWLAAAGLLTLNSGCNGAPPASSEAAATTADNATATQATPTWTMTDKVTKTDEEWRSLLTPEEYRILRRKGTEPSFSGAYWDNHEDGIYACAGCGLVLFTSEGKYDSGCGWPSYWKPAKAEHVSTAVDNTLGMRRTEILCTRCGGHLGHVFEDGPDPTGLRYCVNSASVKFEKGPPTGPSTTESTASADPDSAKEPEKSD